MTVELRLAGMHIRKYLLLGLALLALAVMETLTGQSLGGYGRIFDRADDPKNFWWTVAITYATSLVSFYLYFFHKVPN
jgi:hypothetical protein